jgi:2,3-bisphosphoglycerate-independent phosphoglycerate mutase
MAKKPIALIIMDGFGYNPSDYGNAITAANTPNLDKYMQGPYTYIGASGLDVGLPDGQMGNSEVGPQISVPAELFIRCSLKLQKISKTEHFLKTRHFLVLLKIVRRITLLFT